ncbi:MAG: PspA/IM30 family protein [Lachnospiraceae bacterium]|nr:PspA/IM30 family protein [Lachnospiraceae bacterium]
MGILTRFKDIMSANINALLDKAEDPEKMIDQYLRNIESDLGKVKSETAAVMAEETRCKRQLDECNAEIDKFQKYAEKAVMAGNDNDARQFLAKKAQLEQQRTSLQQAYDIAAANAAKMKQMHDKLCKDIADLNARKDSIKAKMAAAKTQEKLNKLGASVEGAMGSMSAFDRMEAKADQMLDKANAMAELNAGDKDDVEDLAAKYDSVETEAPAVDDALAALKAQMGMQ